MIKTAIAVTLAFIGVANAYISTGECPTPTLKANFDATKYMGLWYEQARDGGMPWESNDCQQARYALNADGTVSVKNTQYNPSSGQVEVATATATFDGAKGSVKFFEYAPAGDYEVLDTDYENFAIVYSCSSYYLAKAEYIWILTRASDISDSLMFSSLQTIRNKVPEYDQTSIRRTLQSGALCKYLNEVQPY
jgi:apolipoprotein D and lipocalin family protein